MMHRLSARGGEARRRRASETPQRASRSSAPVHASGADVSHLLLVFHLLLDERVMSVALSMGDMPSEQI